MLGRARTGFQFSSAQPVLRLSPLTTVDDFDVHATSTNVRWR
jgi:hypothetical protein